MQGPELGVQADDMDLGEPEHEEKQEVLENKDVRLILMCLVYPVFADSYQVFICIFQLFRL